MRRIGIPAAGVRRQAAASRHRRRSLLDQPGRDPAAAG
ncbi:hypothetical protein Mnod_2790 [Methylobacterium nodulans ORS 2060]|uniref:Uncharacterized protein n=1 Tax=Methylobacterium nodulans (strain LMG 21967 / CNCM I-2342 / ORS 2060) TaxID=460265 RepID=B8IFK7_METNO|nr:hypothetical protein Mnod_2790 [Methylobacterium nodulans ORS 2060]